MSSPPPRPGGRIGSLKYLDQVACATTALHRVFAFCPPPAPASNVCVAPPTKGPASAPFHTLPALGGEGANVWFGPSSQAAAATRATTANGTIDLLMNPLVLR